jgi:hypothetical protein
MPCSVDSNRMEKAGIGRPLCSVAVGNMSKTIIEIVCYAFFIFRIRLLSWRYCG